MPSGTIKEKRTTKTKGKTFSQWCVIGLLSLLSQDVLEAKRIWFPKGTRQGQTQWSGCKLQQDHHAYVLELAVRDWTLGQMFLVLIQNCHFLPMFLYSETARWLFPTITSLGYQCMFCCSLYYSSRTTIGVLHAYTAQIGLELIFLLPEWITCAINSYPKQLKILAFDFIFQ